MGASVLFLLADSAAWLFVARGLQGLATGAALSAASASLLDLHPRRDPAGVALTNATVSAGGLGLGLFVSAALVQTGWHPTLVPYAVLLSLIAIAFAGTVFMPEPVRDRRRFRFTFERPHVPPAVRRPFVLAALAIISSWSIAALFFSIGPELGGQLFHTSNAIADGDGIVVLTASAVVAQFLTGRSASWIGASAGSVALAVGISLIVAAAATESTALYLAGSIVAGLGFGAAYFGALRSLVAKIPAEHRAAVMASFYLVGYGSLSVPAILAGVTVSYVSLETTFEIFGSVVAVIAIAVAVEAWRTRPRTSSTAEPAGLDPATKSVGRSDGGTRRPRELVNASVTCH